MYTITILKSCPKLQTSFKDMLDPKRSKFGPKTAQYGRGKIFPDFKQNFSKEDYKNSFYTKNQQNSMSH